MVSAKTDVSVRLAAQPMDCCFHPSPGIVAAGLVTGRVQVQNFAAAPSAQLISLKAHAGSCRAVHFTPDGSLLLSASSDGSLLALDMQQGKPAARLQEAHEAGINRLLFVSDKTFATGDEDGSIKGWDTRQPDACYSLQPHTDYISDLTLHPTCSSLVAVSGDGTLSVTDLRTSKLQARSEEDADDELLSAAVVKQGRKILAGTSTGVLNLYSWGYFNDCSDRFPGHPSSVDALVKYDEDTVLTGSSDGVIRLLTVLPNKLVGVLAHNADYPVERLALSGDKQHLASISHTSEIIIRDVAFLGDESDDEPEPASGDQAVAKRTGPNSVEAGEVGSDDEQQPQVVKGKRRKGQVNKALGPAFFADLL